MKLTSWVVALAIATSMCATARAQQAPAQAGQVPAQAPPPAAGANLGAGTETGIGTFQQRCMGCHGNPNIPQAPAPDAIRQMTPERIYDALTTGLMKPQGDSLTEDQRKMLATF